MIWMDGCIHKCMHIYCYLVHVCVEFTASIVLMSILNVGVAGLAAIQTAKNMGADVRAFDVRPVTKEQVESMGATFLEVPIKEDGSGSGGYAKEMSDEFKKAQAQLMLEQAKEVDIIITTALIPGRKAPILVDQAMLDVMKPGSVCVDLAAANGGNVAQTQPDEIVTTKNNVKIIGYTDLPSRLAATASNLVCICVCFCFDAFIIYHSQLIFVFHVVW